MYKKNSNAKVNSLICFTLLTRNVQSVIFPPITVASIAKRFDSGNRPSSAAQRRAIVYVLAVASVGFGTEIQNVFKKK